jgi:excisionase family DNA binding protein
MTYSVKVVTGFGHSLTVFCALVGIQISNYSGCGAESLINVLGIRNASRPTSKALELISRANHTFGEAKKFMLATARQRTKVGLMLEDPERLLDVSEAAALLNVKTKTLYAWVSRNKIPYRKICSLVRFHRGELIEWAKGQQHAAVATSKSVIVVK